MWTPLKCGLHCPHVDMAICGHVDLSTFHILTSRLLSTVLVYTVDYIQMISGGVGWGTKMTLLGKSPLALDWSSDQDENNTTFRAWQLSIEYVWNNIFFQP